MSLRFSGGPLCFGGPIDDEPVIENPSGYEGVAKCEVDEK
jgi:hypothetical protein